uniref:CARD- and ANK-containing Inflammasome Adaptor Protein n=1 Tax=Gouania willdenowi TaxID=441366 RepID=A0A8C5D4G6_GOUWI
MNYRREVIVSWDAVKILRANPHRRETNYFLSVCNKRKIQKNRRNILELKKVEDKLTKGMSDLIQLIATNGDMALLEKFLNDTDINTVNSSKNTLLHVAAEHGNVSAAELLICKGAKVDLQNNTGCTALHRAASRGHTDIVKALIQAGAPIHVVDDQGRTPVHLAAEQLQLESVSTALHLAAMDGDKHVVASLLSHKAKVLVRDMDGSTPLHYAAAGGHASIVSILLRSVNNRGLEDRNAWRKTSLHVAAEKGHDGVVVVLLETGAKVNATDQSKDTPLHCAARGGHPSVVERLLNWGQTGPKGQQNMVNLSAYTRAEQYIEIQDILSFLFYKELQYCLY